MSRERKASSLRIRWLWTIDQVRRILFHVGVFKKRGVYTMEDRIWQCFSCFCMKEAEFTTAHHK